MKYNTVTYYRDLWRNVRTSRPVRRRGFTITELLVVVGVIVVLISILLPVLSKARNSARMVQCVGNQHQIMQAMIVYCTQNNGYVPPYPSNYDVYWQTNLQFIINPYNATYYNCSSTEPPSQTSAMAGGTANTQYVALGNTPSGTVASSYGFNLTVDSNRPSLCGVDPAIMVRKLSDGPPVVVVADCNWTGFKGDSKTQAPQNMLITPPQEAITGGGGSYGSLGDGTSAGLFSEFVCRCFIDRHQGRIVVGMSDGSAQAIPLRDLWGGVRMNRQGVDRRSLIVAQPAGKSFPPGY